MPFLKVRILTIILVIVSLLTYSQVSHVLSFMSLMNSQVSHILSLMSLRNSQIISLHVTILHSTRTLPTILVQWYSLSVAFIVTTSNHGSLLGEIHFVGVMVAMGDIRSAPGHATSKTGDYRSLGGAGTFRDSGPGRTWRRDFLVILMLDLFPYRLWVAFVHW